MLFKIKRKLAQYNIGNPLLLLFKTADEIEKMKSNGEILPKKMFHSNKKEYKMKQNKTGKIAIAVLCGGRYYLLRYKFNSVREAKEWGLWNYKGRTNNWKIVK